MYEVQSPDRPSRCAIKIPKDPQFDYSIEGECEMLEHLKNVVRFSLDGDPRIHLNVIFFFASPVLLKLLES